MPATYNQSSMPLISTPGTRETRRVTLSDEIRRVVYCGGGMVFATLLLILSLWWDMSNLGPLIGVIAGVILFSCMARYIQISYSEATPLILSTLLIVLIAWGWVGYEWCSGWWPTRMNLYPSVTFFSTLLSIAIKGISALMGWAFFTELVDPNGPTPPRHATIRDKAIYPWSRETYGGKQLPDQILLANPVTRTVRVELTSNGGKTDDYFVGIPDTPQWKAFCAAVVRKPASFTEAEAKAHGVRLDDILDGQGDVIQFGMRTIRSRLIDRGFARWKNPQVHERGLIVLAKGKAVLRAVAQS